MHNLVTIATLVMSVPDGISDQEAFVIINKNVNPFGIDFIWPAYPGIDKPAIIARILKLEKNGDIK